MQPITKLTFTGVDGSKYKFDVYPRGIRVMNIWPFVVPSLLVILTALRQL